MMNRQETRKAAKATTSPNLLTAQVRTGSMKNQFAAAVLRTVASTPGPKPPYHAAIATAGKKKMNGNAVGPTAGVSASLDSQPRMTVAEAMPYRAHSGRGFGLGFRKTM